MCDAVWGLEEKVEVEALGDFVEEFDFCGVYLLVGVDYFHEVFCEEDFGVVGSVVHHLKCYGQGYFFCNFESFGIYSEQ